MTVGEKLWDRLHHLILPTLVLAAGELAGIMRQMRSNLLDMVNECPALQQLQDKWLTTDASVPVFK